MKKLLAILLVLASMIAVLAGCGGKPEETTKNEGDSNETVAPEGNPLDNVDFKGTDLRVCISVNQDRETTIPACDRYTRGLDDFGDDPVLKEVYNRNKTVEDQLNLNIEYQERDWHWDEVAPDLDKIIQGAAEDAPDIYNNDIYGITKGLFKNYYRNIMNPDTANGEKSYFDFSKDCWYTDYMKGLTFSPEKQYLLAGDYFLDILRMSWVLYVNIDLFNDIFADLYGDIDALYGEVLDGIWDYDRLISYASQSYRDTNGSGESDPEDELIGLVCPYQTDNVFVMSSGLSTTRKNEKTGLWELRENLPDYYELSRKFSQLWNSEGLYHINTSDFRGNLEAVELFIKGNALFSIACLGELESEQVRNQANLTKGLVPAPKYNVENQDGYHTMVHNQAELAVLLNTTKKFAEASAWLQLSCEKSDRVLSEYYDKALMLRFNDFPHNREMIDLIRHGIDNPFQYVIFSEVGNYAGSGVKNITAIIYQDAVEEKDSFNSAYTASYPALAGALEKLLNIFEGLE